MLGDWTSPFPEISCMSRVQVWDLPASEIHEGWGQHHVETKGTEEKNRFSSVPIKSRNWIDQTSCFFFFTSVSWENWYPTPGDLAPLFRLIAFGSKVTSRSRNRRPLRRPRHRSGALKPWCDPQNDIELAKCSSLVEVSKAASLHRFFAASGVAKFAKTSNLKVPS